MVTCENNLSTYGFRDVEDLKKKYDRAYTLSIVTLVFNIITIVMFILYICCWSFSDNDVLTTICKNLFVLNFFVTNILIFTWAPLSSFNENLHALMPDCSAYVPKYRLYQNLKIVNLVFIVLIWVILIFSIFGLHSERQNIIIRPIQRTRVNQQGVQVPI